MNKQMIRYVLGLVLLIEGALLLLPLAVALLYQETTWKHFGLTIAWRSSRLQVTLLPMG